jgi:peptidoglycan/LPS O-acetylase OafA/YrhL
MLSNKDMPVDHRSNSFDIMRHIAALAVIVSHHFAFNGLEEPKAFGVTKLGTFAVIVFFSISGFLITKSFYRSSDALSYIKKRILRISPGLIVCAFITSFIICGIFGKLGFIDWVTSLRAVKTFVYYSLFGSHATGESVNYFTSNYIFPNSVNSSLWTLLFEFMDYIAVIVIFTIFKNKLIGSLVFLFSAIALLIVNNHFSISSYLVDRAAALSIPFAIGSLLFSIENIWKDNNKVKALLLLLSIVGIAASPANDERSILFLTAAATAVIIIGMSIKDIFIKGRFDFSYGIYIYAFPVQQICSNLVSSNFYVSMACSFVITIVLASMSWFFVEKKFLQRKVSSKLTQASA